MENTFFTNIKQEQTRSSFVVLSDNFCDLMFALLDTNLSQSLPEKGFNLKGNLLPRENKSFPFRTDPFSERSRDICNLVVFFESISFPLKY